MCHGAEVGTCCQRLNPIHLPVQASLSFHDSSVSARRLWYVSPTPVRAASGRKKARSMEDASCPVDGKVWRLPAVLPTHLPMPAACLHAAKFNRRGSSRQNASMKEMPGWI